MNHIYRTVFNRALGVCQAVAETARGRGKGASGRRRAALRPLAAIGLVALLTAAPVAPAMAAGDILTGGGDGGGGASGS
ncbi:ESPR domain-containing protein, partial [Phytopseudomonas daroniae]|uniref:ESPR domain-containing protein n=1 Tax=Pseudomonas sp. FRB 228 TaxID=3084966 RepID=UPI0010382F4B